MRYSRKLRIPVVFSPDSSLLSVSYSASPYNRIVIYDASPSYEAASYGDTLVNQFKREVVRAISLSIKTPFWHIASEIFSDALQPASLLNMPLSFVEGATYTVTEQDNRNLLSDIRSLQILSQSKLEKKFPSWRKITGASDIYPGKELDVAASRAFAAYLQSRWGMEQYINFWHASGSVHLFSFTEGIFQSVYDISLKQAWENFKESVPLPKDLDELYTLSEKCESLLKYKYDRLPKNLVINSNNIVWYDNARNEVCILGENRNAKKLFSAIDVKRLSFSKDGKYLALSFYAQTSRNNLKKHAVKLYDIEEKEFITTTLSLKDASPLLLEDGTPALVGLETNGQKQDLCVYKINDKKTFEKIYSRSFESTCTLYSPIAISKDLVACLIVENNERNLFVASFKDMNEKVFKIKYAISSLEHCSTGLIFSYTDKEAGTLNRVGFIHLNSDNFPIKISVQSSDIFGGIHYPALNGEDLIFCSMLTYSSEISYLPLSALSFKTEELNSSDKIISSFDDSILPVIEKREIVTENGKIKKKKFMGETELASYNPFRYIFRGTWIPMLPVAGFSFKDGYILSPGLGLTYLTESDPFDVVKAVLSFGTGFAEPESNYQTFTKEMSLAAYATASFFPVDISAGLSWRFTKGGAYTLQLLSSAKYQVPLGMNYHHLELRAQHLWKMSTTYTDPDTKITSEKKAWTSLSNAFHDNQFSLTISYNDYRKNGISEYEQLGFGIDGTLLLDYDAEKISKGQSPLRPTNFSFGVNLDFKIPRIHPVSYINNFVVGFPISISSKWFGETGTSCDTSFEVLLFGYESHIGIPILNLYLVRLGL
ncbi:MAG: hypothetical protein IJR49_01205, partial [Treponema sp.]|nr:hypothetical protein [Treponema sp.]